LKTGYIDSLKWGKKVLQTAVLGYIFIYIQTKHKLHNSLYVLGSWGKNLSQVQFQ